MTLLHTLPTGDRLLAAALAALTAATILMAADAHAFCRIFCLHGMPMIESEICSGRT